MKSGDTGRQVVAGWLHRPARILEKRPRVGELVFAGLGALLTLTFAPFSLHILAPLLVLPLLGVALLAAPRRAAQLGFAWGVGLFLSGTYWIYVSVHVFGQAPLWIAILLMLGLVLIMSGYCALIGWSLAWLAGGNPVRLAVTGPAAWVLVEWLRGWVLTGFPWLALGYAQVDTPLAGWAPVFGVYGVSWMLLVSTCGLLLVLMRERPGVGLALLLSPWAGGFALQFVPWTEPDGEPFRVTIVQGGVSQDRKWLPEQFGTTLEIYRNALLDAESSPVVVWPEVAIPALVDQVDGYLELLQTDLLPHGRTLALGILERDIETRAIYNSLLMLDGSTRQVYRKRHLVPFGEYFPVPDFVREWMRLMSLPNNDMTPGDDEQPLLVAANGTRMAVAICYEDAYAAEQLYALPDAAVLINVSNDAWFGDSIAPHQHLQIARMRALEAGRWVIRATNNGISAFIGPTGEVGETAPQFRFATLARTVEPRRGLTPYARTGNAPLLLVLASLAVAGRRVRRR